MTSEDWEQRIAALFERACANDSTGRPDAAEPF
jgi:hypothetical protein